jgi:hypothetical protein
VSHEVVSDRTVDEVVNAVDTILYSGSNTEDGYIAPIDAFRSIHILPAVLSGIAGKHYGLNNLPSAQLIVVA